MLMPVLVRQLLVLVRRLLVVLVLVQMLLVQMLLVLLLLLLLQRRTDCCTLWLALVCLLRCQPGDSSTQLLQVWGLTRLQLQRAVVLPHRPPSWNDRNSWPPVCLLRTCHHTPGFLLHRPRVHGWLEGPLLPAAPTLLRTA
jgi:hypothetical protein